jgi:hypothetical protein
VLAAKQVPQIEVSPLALAVWFMDDGSRSRNAVYLNTQQFDCATQQRLLDLLWQQHGIKATLNRDRTYHRIRVSVAGTARLAQLVAPHLHKEFLYKLPHVTL